MSSKSELLIEEIRDLVIRIPVLYSFLTVSSKKKLKRSMRENPMKKLVTVKDLHQFIDPNIRSSKWILFVLPNGKRYTVGVKDDLPMILKNCRYLLEQDIAKN